MKVDKKELKAHIKNEKATLKQLKAEGRELEKMITTKGRAINAQIKLVDRLETKLANAK